MSSVRGDRPDVVLVADWGKDPEQRAVWRADMRDSTISRLRWKGQDLAHLLATAVDLASHARVLAVIDVALGLTAAAWQETGRHSAPTGAQTSFPGWLERQAPAQINRVVTGPADWSSATPFFRVANEKGGRDNFIAGVGRARIYRAVDDLAGAKCPYLTGLPGYVGGASQSAWVELIDLLRGRQWGFWPFDGRIEQIFENRAVALAESYPAKMYRIALPEAAVPTKSKSHSRAQWLDVLAASDWIREERIQIADLAAAEVNENEFDCCAMAAAIVRLIREGRSLDSQSDDPVAGGGILGLDEALIVEGGPG